MKEKIENFIIYFLPPILFMGVVFWLSSIPNLKIDDTDAEFFRRKTIHILEFGFLWILVYRAILKEKWFSNYEGKIRAVLGTVVFTILYGASDEWHQSFVPTRDGRATDVIFDSLGVILAVAFLNLMVQKKKKKITEKVEREKMSLWPILLGFVIILGIIIGSYFYYKSYCPFI